MAELMVEAEAVGRPVEEIEEAVTFASLACSLVVREGRAAVGLFARALTANVTGPCLDAV